MPEKTVVNFDSLKRDFLEPLSKYVSLSGIGELVFSYETDEMIGVYLEIKNKPAMAIDFYLDGSVIPDTGVEVESRDWISGAKKIIGTIVSSVEGAGLAAKQLEKLQRAAKAMQESLSS